MYRKMASPERYTAPDCAVIHQELKRKGVTLQLLWEEYQTELRFQRTNLSAQNGSELSPRRIYIVR